MQLIDAFVTNRTSAKTLADGLRNGIRAMAKNYGFDYHDRLEWLVADKIDELISENKKLQAERDAAVAEVEELNDDFVECVCSGYGNLSPYCGNRCAECVDKRGWCKEVTKYCRGFIPMSYKDWRGVQKEKE